MRGKYCQCKDNVLSGQSLTKYICKECNQEKIHSNIRIPKYCIDCAIKLQICNHCGLPINLLD